MSTVRAPEPVPQRSYCGIGGCVLFAIGTACLGAVVLMNWHAELKMPGFEIIVLGPAAVLIYVAGLMMGLAGVRQRQENPLCMPACVLNAIPLAGVLLIYLHAAFR
jgi:hypothetical protein